MVSAQVVSSATEPRLFSALVHRTLGATRPPSIVTDLGPPAKRARPSPSATPAALPRQKPPFSLSHTNNNNEEQTPQGEAISLSSRGSPRTVISSSNALDGGGQRADPGGRPFSSSSPPTLPVLGDAATTTTTTKAQQRGQTPSQEERTAADALTESSPEEEERSTSAAASSVGGGKNPLAEPTLTTTAASSAMLDPLFPRPRAARSSSSSSEATTVSSATTTPMTITTAAGGSSVGAASMKPPQPPPPQPPKTGRWTKREDEQLRATVSRFGQSGAPPKDWALVARLAFNGGRTDAQCRDRWEKVLKLGLVKGPWRPEEDDVVRRAVEAHVARQRAARSDGPDASCRVAGDHARRTGNNHALHRTECNWAEVAKLLPGRLTKQVRERWQNHLNPALVKSPWTEEEDYLLVSLQAVLGNRWNEIARAFQGRSENAIKNRWNSKQRRTLVGGGGGDPSSSSSSSSSLPAASSASSSGATTTSANTTTTTTTSASGRQPSSPSATTPTAGAAPRGVSSDGVSSSGDPKSAPPRASSDEGDSSSEPPAFASSDATTAQSAGPHSSAPPSSSSSSAAGRDASVENLPARRQPQKTATTADHTGARPTSSLGVRNVCRTVNFHKALIKASGADPEINAAASILVNTVGLSAK